MKVSFDYGKLRGKIVEKYGSIEKFSKAFGETATTVGRKLSGKNDWTQGNIIKTCTLLDIPIEEIAVYFFCKIS